MARKPKTTVPAEPEVDYEFLRAIVNFGPSGTYVDPAQVGQLAKYGYVELNPEFTDGDKVACRATDKGYAHFAVINNELSTAVDLEEVKKMTATTDMFAIDTDVPLVRNTKRGGGKGKAAIYPYDKLEVNQSFHIPATDAVPAPHKARASLISLWNNKYSHTNGTKEFVKVVDYQKDASGKRVKVDGHFVKVGERMEERAAKHYDRKFAIVAVGADDPRGKGARIFRIA